MPYQNSFYDLFFNSPLSKITTLEFKQQLFEDLKHHVHTYEALYPVPACDNSQLDAWYHDKGQVVLITAFENLWKILSSLSKNAMPAHDARHAMFKVPISSLELIHSEGVLGWERVAVLSALMHDWGRWAEERIFGYPQVGVIHARMSFVLAKEFLSEYDIPEAIQWHILHAVLIHTKGAVEADPMVAKITVTADREQLWGPEYVIRLLHHVKSAESCHVIYPQEGSYDIYSNLKRIFVTRLTGPLYSRDSHLTVSKGQLGQFLYMAGTDEFRENIISFMEASQDFIPIDYEALIKEADCFYTPIKSPGEALENLLNCKHLASNQKYVNEAVQRVMQTPYPLNSRLTKAIMFICKARIEEDKRVKLALNFLLKEYKQDRFLYHVSILIHDNF